VVAVRLVLLELVVVVVVVGTGLLEDPTDLAVVGAALAGAVAELGGEAGRGAVGRLRVVTPCLGGRVIVGDDREGGARRRNEGDGWLRGRLGHLEMGSS